MDTTPNLPQRNVRKFIDEGWEVDKFDVQSWLERSPWRVIKDTEYGVANNAPMPHRALWEDKLISEIYKIDLATFLTAERISMLGISRLVSCAPDEASSVFLATQAADEARHFEIFSQRMADFGVSPEQRNQMMDRVTTPAMRKFYDLIAEQVDKKQFAEAMLAHNVILEGMAYPVYRYEAAYWSVFDPQLTAMIKGAFADEVHHVAYGEAIMRNYTAKGDKTRNTMQRLAREFRQLMTEVFESTIEHYIGIYQLAADAYMDEIGDIRIFPGKKMDVTEREQVETLMHDVNEECDKRLERIGLL
jgi:hypothetical protein